MTETLCGKCKEYICDCTCPDVTGYSQKRRLLTEHRKTMRVMQDVIWDNNLHDQYCEALRAAPADPQDWWPGPDYEELDESSDVEDPEKKARDDLEEYKREVADKETLFQITVVEMARRSVENNQVWLELERARMEREKQEG